MILQKENVKILLIVMISHALKISEDKQGMIIYSVWCIILSQFIVKI